MGEYYYRKPDTNKSNSLTWRLGLHLDDNEGPTWTREYKLNTVKKQNKALKSFFEDSEIQALMKENKWREIFNEWKVVNSWSNDVLAFFLYNLGIDFLAGLDNNEKLQFLHDFILPWEER